MNRLIGAGQRIWIAWMAAAVLSGAAACGPGDGTSERIEESREAGGEATGDGPLAASATGNFELSLTGDFEERVQGEVVCTVGAAASGLRAVMQPRRGVERTIVIEVPEYQGTGTYDGTVQVTGARRSTGPAEVAVSSVPGEAGVLQEQIAVAFRGTYAGEAGTGEIEGEARCIPGGEGAGGS